MLAMTSSETKSSLLEQTREQLKRALEVTGLTPTQLAREAGLTHATLTRFLNQPGKYNLSLSTMNKIHEAVLRIIGANGKDSESVKKQLDYFHGGGGDLEPVSTNDITIHVRGAVQAGHWAEAAEWPQDEWETVTLPRPNGYKSYFGLKVKGPSMNKEYPEGTILVCVPIWDYRQAVESGDHVIVHRHDGGGLSEATVKELVIDEDGRYWLWPRSNHPEHQQPMEVPAAAVDEPDTAGVPSIQITAIVVADYRIRRRGKNKSNR